MNLKHACVLGVLFVSMAMGQEKPKRGWLDKAPPDYVRLDCGQRNPLYYPGDPITFRLTGDGAERYEVRDYWGELVDNGPAAPSITLKAQPLGWYKLYLFGKPVAEPKKETRTAEEKELAGDNTKAKESATATAQAAWNYRQMFGDVVGSATFIVIRDNPNFPRLPPPGKFPNPGNNDEVMRGVSGMGPQRHAADASKPEQSIKNLEAEIATDRAMYLPYDPARHRALMIAFPGGTKGHLDGVKQIVEHFKDDVKYYEPRNEPNYGASGSGFVKDELVDFYKTVKSVDPTLKVLGPGAVTINPNGNGLGFIEDFLKAGGADVIDGFSFHIYNGVNGELWLTRKSMGGLTTLLKKYHADNKELWQTEQGFFACVYGSYQPRLQSRWTMLEMMVFEQFHLPKEHNHLWYDVSHGFWDVPTWWENDDHGFNPVVPLMRVWSEELFGTQFARAYDFGAVGNKLVVGSLFTGDKKRVAAFMSPGSPDGKIALRVKGGPAKIHVVSAFGIESDLPVTGDAVTLPVPELPVYVELAEGQELEAVPTNYGPDLAMEGGVKVTVSGTGVHPLNPKTPNDPSKIINGQWKNWYYTQQLETSTWMDDTKGFPAWVQLTFPKPTDISRVIIYCPTPWQVSGTLVDYELQYDDGGKWVTLEHVNEPLKTFKSVAPATRTKCDSFFSDRHIFQHEFKPVNTTKIRIYVHNTTFGGGATQEVVDAGGQTGVHQMNLVEVEVYGK